MPTKPVKAQVSEVEAKMADEVAKFINNSLREDTAIDLARARLIHGVHPSGNGSYGGWQPKNRRLSG